MAAMAVSSCPARSSIYSINTSDSLEQNAPSFRAGMVPSGTIFM